MGQPATIPHVAKHAAELWSDEPAIIQAGETWSFADLWRRARAAASGLIASGVGQGDRIAIWAPNSREWIVVALAAQATGAAIVPLNTRLKGREAADILRRTSAKMLFTVDNFLGTDYPALLAKQDLPDLDETLLIGRDLPGLDKRGSGEADERVDAALEQLTSDDVSDIMFTSGTTGAPKGVVTTHGSIVPMFHHWVGLMGLEKGERYLIINPFFHSFGFKAGWVAALVAGAVTIPVANFDVDEVIRRIEQDRINFLPGPPTIYQALLAAKAENDFDTSSLRGAATGAASVPPELIRRMRAELGLRDTVTAYGMTECTTITACRRGDDAELIAQSVGKAIPGLEVRVIDEDGEELPRGEAGEICVRGYGVMREYLDDPDATASAFDADGWLHTGDIGTMDADGYVRITDRLKDMYISGGFNCYPAEIEKLLSEHPEIGTVAVIGVPDERLGEVGKAFVIPRPGKSLSAESLLAWARANMANYKVPREFKVVSELPLNASGKVLKTELREG
ncbi:FadD3 family acyl-CoA ligase [Erythrobacter alti]|uniref:FadD3 family acyl-CoA ligase n=1 Tax=Erythrobacter alti TaxID=1896145 RepID=UPI0030F43CBF